MVMDMARLEVMGILIMGLAKGHTAECYAMVLSGIMRGIGKGGECLASTDKIAILGPLRLLVVLIPR